MPRRVFRLLAVVEAALLGVCLLAGGGARPLSAPAPTAYAGPLAQATPVAGAAASQVRRDVTYCTASGVALKMDVYLPKSPGGRVIPAVVYVHGGGWSAGDKSWIGSAVSPLTPDDLTTRGIAVAAVNFRLAPQYKWPAQIQDVKCAIRSLRANASSYGIDPARIGIYGESSGAHLVSIAALTSTWAGFDGSSGYPDKSSRVQAAVEMFGPTDFNAYSLDSFTLGMAKQLMGFTPDKSDLARVSPVTYVSASAPPFFIVQGEKDTLVPQGQAQALLDKLRGVGVSADMLVVKNSGHTFAPTGGALLPAPTEVRKRVADFLVKQLAAPQTSWYFTQTGKVAAGKFLAYWQKNGGLAQQGYPISDELQEQSDTDGKTYIVQYFERAVFEYHPENKPPYDILLSLLGNFRYKAKFAGGAPGQKANTSPGSTLFKETGHRAGGIFLDYWQKNGGLAQQGYPISDEFTEKSELDGKTYTVQYFERAVFEYHPEKPDPYRVLLSQLGTFRYAAEGGR